MYISIPQKYRYPQNVFGGFVITNCRELEGVRGVLFDCYKTLIDIKTDEKSLRTYEPLSR